MPNGHPPATIVDGIHRYTLRAYFEDTDAGGIVYHATYLRWAERGRTEALRDLGVPHAELVAAFRLMFVVRRIQLDYLRPARLDDLLTVTTRPLAVGGASVVLRQGFERVDEAGELAVATLKLGCIAVGRDRAERIPERWRLALGRMQQAARADDGPGGRTPGGAAGTGS